MSLLVASINVSKALQMNINPVNLQPANVVLRAGTSVPPGLDCSGLNLRRRSRLHVFNDEHLLLQFPLPGRTSIFTELGQAGHQSDVKLARTLNTLLVAQPCDVLIEPDDVVITGEPCALEVPAVAAPPSSDRGIEVAQDDEAAPEVAEQDEREDQHSDTEAETHQVVSEVQDVAEGDGNSDKSEEAESKYELEIDPFEQAVS